MLSYTFVYRTHALLPTLSPPPHSEKMRLDGVVTLVDAKHCELHLDEEKPEGKINETVEQIAMADRILLNKIDLVDENDLERVEGRIRAINSLAEVCECVVEWDDFCFCCCIEPTTSTSPTYTHTYIHTHTSSHSSDCANTT